MSKSKFKRPPNKFQQFFAKLWGLKNIDLLATPPPLSKRDEILSEQGKHYFVNGSWHPVILNPMGEQTPELGKQWIAEQKTERDVLIATGASVGC